ncbi:MAG: winged helix-turn-helix transcriptional regulator [Rhodobacteraceae bacterium]|nr:winged helix-turn-helix transcriptional regulator [Paracoccaceae bacterium]MBR9823762.1 winged helix-turn-helix transcriptional regulator [Paracoccaceae bacterium]
MTAPTRPTRAQIDAIGAAMDDFARRYKLSMATAGDVQLNELDKLILLHLAQTPDTGPTDVARWFGVPATTTTSATDRLVKRGLVERHRPDTDRRAVALRLSDKGRALTETMAAVHLSLYEQLLMPLDPDERDALIRLLNKITSSET